MELSDPTVIGAGVAGPLYGFSTAFGYRDMNMFDARRWPGSEC